MKKLLFIGVNLLFTLNILFGQISIEGETSPATMFSNFNVGVPPSPTAASLGMFTEMPVNLYTGLPQISYPLYNLKLHGNFSLPISLSYHTSGVKVNEVPGWVGSNWSLSAGGAITRVMNYLPDELDGITAKGYLHNEDYFYDNNIELISSNYSLVNTTNAYLMYGQLGFNCTADAVNSFYNGEITFSELYGHLCVNSQQYPWDIPMIRATNIEEIANGSIDSQPDIFYFNFNGHSGKMMIDLYSDEPGIQFVTFPHQNWDISVNSDFTEFTITTDDGVIYTFGDAAHPENYTEQTYAGTECSENTYIQETYTSAWYLKNINYGVNFIYDNLTNSYNDYIEQETEYYTLGPSGESQCTNMECDSKGPYSCITNTSHSQLFLSQIITDNETVNFYKSETSRSCGYQLDKIEIIDNTYNIKKELTFGYLNTSNRHFLTSINGLYAEPICFTYTNPGALPGFHSKKIDLWGYYNGKHNSSLIPRYVTSSLDIDGADRRAVESNMKAGLISKITHPTKGETTFNFEANKVNDSHAIINYIDVYLSDEIERLPQPIPDPNPTEYSETFEIEFKQLINVDIDFINLNEGIETDGIVQILDSNDEEVKPYTSDTNSELFLEEGTYTLYAKIEIPDNKIDFEISYKRMEDSETGNQTVGGLRIKEINFNDNKGGTIKKVYDYNVNGKSSGEYITSVPKYYYTFDERNYCGGSTDAGMGELYDYNCKYLVLNGSAVNSILTSNGSYLGYTNVSEALYKSSNADGSDPQFPLIQDAPGGEIDSEVGKVTYEYRKIYSKEFNSQPSAMADLREYTGGFLKSIKYYNSSNKLLKSIDNDYNIIHPAETDKLRIISGIKVTPASVTTDLYGANNTASWYHFLNYYYFSGWSYLNKKTVKTFEYNEDGTEKAVLENVFEYDYDVEDKKINSETITTANGKIIERLYKHPYDFKNERSPIYDSKFKYWNRHFPVAFDEYEIIGGTKKHIRSNVFEYFGMLPSRLHNLIEEPAREIPYSNELYTTWVDGLPEYELNKLVIYDINGDPSKIISKDGANFSYKWSPVFNGPEVKIAGSSNYYYQSCEHSILSIMDEEGENEARTGYCYVNYDNFPDIDFTNFKTSTYIIEYWWKENLGEEWNLIRDEFDIDAQNQTYLIEKTSGYFDDIRVFEKGVQMYTYTYHPFHGMTSETDPNNKTTYYEYDDYGRLTAIKDHEKNILKAFNYSYSNTTNKNFKVNGNEDDFNLNIYANVENTSINIESNMYWTVSAEADWLTLDMLNGVGNQALTISSGINEGADDRVAEIIFTADGSSVILTLTQDQDLLEISNNSIYNDYQETTEVVSITSTTDWNVNVAPEIDWVTVSPSGGSKNNDIQIQIDRNTGTSSRNTQIDISTAMNTESVLVFQDGQLLEFPAGSIELDHQSQTISFDVVSNLSWHLGVVEIDSWIHYVNYSGNENGTITLNFDENSTGVDRLDTLWLLGGDIVIEIPIIQKALPVLNLSKSIVDFNFYGGSQQVFITSNQDWNVTSNVSWLQIDNTSGSDDGSFTITCPKNTNGVAQNGVITVTGDGLIKTINISQEGPVLSVDNSDMDIDPIGESNTLNINSNISWAISASDTWMHFDKTSGGNDEIVTITFDPNLSGANKNATITVSGEGIVHTINVFQAEPFINILYDNATVHDYNPVNETILVESNVDWGVLNLLMPDWLGLTPASGFNENVTLTATKNTGDYREWSLTFQNSIVNLSEDLIIKQNGVILESSVSNLDFDFNGTGQSITITSDVSWSVTDKPDWINLSVMFSTGNTVVIVSADANNLVGGSDRSGTITFEGEGKTLELPVYQEKYPLLTISPPSFSFDIYGGTETVTVTSDQNWAISDNQSWISLSKSSGSDDGSFTVTCSQNTSGSDRSGTITISGGGLTRTITVNQDGIDLTVSPTTLSYGPSGSSQTVTVSSNVNNWAVSESYSWISVSKTSGSGNSTFSITCTENTTSSARNGTVTVSVEGITRTISVSQEKPTLTASSANLNFGSGEETKNVYVTSNLDWHLGIFPMWISTSASSTNGNGTLSITCEANSASLPRTATITLTGGNLTKTIDITQEAGAIGVTPTSLNFINDGETKTFSITAHGNWTISDSESWITVGSTSGSGNAIIFVTCDPGVMGERTGTITVSSGGDTKTVSVTQAGRLMQQ